MRLSAEAGFVKACASTFEGDGVALEVLKKAEKEECLVVRLVERLGRKTTARVNLNTPGARLVETDLLEWHELSQWGGDCVKIPMKAFEIRTFKVLGLHPWLS